MLVCAPTGAGKTNIAMIAVLHEVSQHRNASSGVIDKDNFKIVYVAPMKALAAEVTRTFGTRLQALGMQVCWHAEQATAGGCVVAPYHISTSRCLVQHAAGACSMSSHICRHDCAAIAVFRFE